MGVVFGNVTNHPWILGGEQVVKTAETIVQDAGRTEALAFGTVMGYDASAQKWAPLTAVTTKPTVGIYIGTGETAADIVAGDISNVTVVVLGDALILDKNQIVLENSLTLDSVIGSTEETIETCFLDKGIIFKDSIAGSQFD